MILRVLLSIEINVHIRDVLESLLLYSLILML